LKGLLGFERFSATRNTPSGINARNVTNLGMRGVRSCRRIIQKAPTKKAIRQKTRQPFQTSARAALKPDYRVASQPASQPASQRKI
jgi:hypothetical protein